MVNGAPNTLKCNKIKKSKKHAQFTDQRQKLVITGILPYTGCLIKSVISK